MKKETWAKLESRPALFFFSALSLVAAFGLASAAIDTGSLLQYALALFFLTLSLRDLLKGIFYRRNGHR